MLCSVEQLIKLALERLVFDCSEVKLILQPLLSAANHMLVVEEVLG
jgi:hypothetical protein